MKVYCFFWGGIYEGNMSGRESRGVDNHHDRFSFLPIPSMWSFLVPDLIHTDARISVSPVPGMWPFIVPDLIHTLVMLEYLFLWLRKIQTDSMKMIRDGWGMLDSV